MMRHIREMLRRAGFGPSISEQRQEAFDVKKASHEEKLSKARQLIQQGDLNNAQIAKALDIPENTVRALR